MSFDGSEGDIVEYLSMFDGRTSFARFSGQRPFDMLWELGYLVHGVSQVRFFSLGASDQHYLVLDDGRLEGIELQAHSGISGVHEFSEVYTDSFNGWEAYNLSRDPVPRT